MNNWIFWICVIIFVFFVIWILDGGKERNFIGLSRFDPSNDLKDIKKSNHISEDENEDEENLTEISDITYAESSSSISIHCDKDIPLKKSKVSKGEKICCETMQEIYGVPFETYRPEFLKNPESGRNLEIDCYNRQLKIGVEYKGIQHYVWPNFTRDTKEAFINQIRRDKYKYDMCEKNGVYLISVPYTVPHSKIKDFIIKNLPKNDGRIIKS